MIEAVEHADAEAGVPANTYRAALASDGADPIREGYVPTVETVRGPVDLADLGPTLMHEHVFVLDPEALENYGHVWGERYWDEECASPTRSRSCGG